MRELYRGNPSRAREVMIGYQEYYSPFHFEPSIWDFYSVGRTIFSKNPIKSGAPKALRWLTTDDVFPEGQRKPKFVNPDQFTNPAMEGRPLTSDRIEYLRRKREIQDDPDTGRTDKQFLRFFATDDGVIQRDDVSGYEQDILILSSIPAEEADKRQNYVSYMNQKYGHTPETIEQGVLVARDYIAKDSNSPLIGQEEEAFRRLRENHEDEIIEIENKMAGLEQLRRQDDANQLQIQQLEKEIAQKASALEEKLRTEHAESGEQLLSEASSDEEPVNQEQEAPPAADETVAAQPPKEVTPKCGKHSYGGAPLCSDHHYELTVFGLTGELMGNTIILFGGDADVAAKFDGFSKGIIYGADGLSYLSKNGFGGDPTDVLTAMNSVAFSANLLISVFSSGEEDPMQEVFEQLFAILDVLLQQQQQILENQQDMIASQASILYSIETIRSALQNLQEQELEQRALILQQFANTNSLVTASYVDLQSRIEALREDVALAPLYIAIDNLQAALNLNADDNHELTQESQDLSQAVARLNIPIRRLPLNPPQLTIQQLKDEYNSNWTEKRRAISSNDARLHYWALLSPFCKDELTCSVYKGAPDVEGLQSLANTYATAADLLSMTPEGRDFLQQDITGTFAELSNAIEQLNAITQVARRHLPQIYENYASSIEELRSLTHQYGTAALASVGGTQFGASPLLRYPWRNFQSLPDGTAPRQVTFDLSQGHLDEVLIQLMQENVLRLAPEALEQMTEEQLANHSMMKEYRSLYLSSRVAANLGLGIFRKDPWPRYDQTSNLQNNHDRRHFLHLFLMADPLMVEDDAVRGRLESLMSRETGDKAIYDAAITKGWITNVLGGSAYASNMFEIYDGGAAPANNPYCRSYQTLGIPSSMCVVKAAERWITDHPVEVPMNQERWEVVRPCGVDHQYWCFKSSQSDDPDYIKKVIRKEVDTINAVRFRAIQLASQDVLGVLMAQWNSTLLNGISNYDALPAPVNSNRLSELATALYGGRKKLEAARLAYILALEVAYGEECIYSPRAHKTLLAQGQLLATNRFLSSPSLTPKGEDKGLLKDLAEPIRMMESSMHYAAAIDLSQEGALPELADIKYSCAVGLGGADRLAQYASVHHAWVSKHGADPDAVFDEYLQVFRDDTPPDAVAEEAIQ